jgi:gamma-glutamyltranspeptidase/glutathione hydrolase
MNIINFIIKLQMERLERTTKCKPGKAAGSKGQKVMSGIRYPVIGLLVGILIIFQLSGCNSADTDTVDGSVASAHPLATKAGMDILGRGGNAFDAAIAVAACLNVVEPMMSGIGGYGTILIYDAKGNEVRFLNPSGRFPLQTNTDLMREPTPGFMENRVGPKSISTPGNLNAWVAMHEEYGELPWAELFESAITYADDGFELSSKLASAIRSAFDDFSPYAQSFYGREGEPLSEGDVLVQPDLAKTLRIIADNGASPFYNGDIATAIDKQMKASGSFLSLEDLMKNEAEWYEPVMYSYRDHDVYTASLPANSFAAFVNLGLMNQVPAGELEHNSTDYLHLFAEMTKESYKARLLYSFDPEVREAPLDSILDERCLKDLLLSFDREKAGRFELPFSPESRNTTHFVIVDKWGNIVSATQTLGNAFGSRIMVEGTGIWMNNSMAYSTFEPKGNPMDAFPGRHKLSGDCPVIIMKEGKPYAALGSPGGHTITQNVPQIIFNLVDFNMSMQEAIDAPKIAFAEPDIILYDNDLPADIVRSLEERGHRMRRGSIGNAYGIRIVRDKAGRVVSLEAGFDKRGR